MICHYTCEQIKISIMTIRSEKVIVHLKIMLLNANILFSVNALYLSVVHVLNYVWKWIITWASRRKDYMPIGAFNYAQVVSSIPSVLIGCEPRSGYASVHICWPLVGICLLADPSRTAEPVSIVSFLLCSSFIILNIIKDTFPEIKVENVLWILEKES